MLFYILLASFLSLTPSLALKLPANNTAIPFKKTTSATTTSSNSFRNSTSIAITSSSSFQNTTSTAFASSDLSKKAKSTITASSYTISSNTTSTKKPSSKTSSSEKTASKKISRTISSNATTTSSHPVVSNCCFVVQDAVSEYYWQSYDAFYLVVSYRITSITTLVTPFADTTITRYKTKIYTSNSIWGHAKPSGTNPIPLASNEAPQPTQVVSTILSGNHIITAGKTIHSPSAFWVISSVKIITVPAVTDAKGNAVCAITSKGTRKYVRSTTEDIAITLTSLNGTSKKVHTTISEIHTKVTDNAAVTVTGVNSNAEAYFGGYNISSEIQYPFTVSISGYSTKTHHITRNETRLLTSTTHTIWAISTSTVYIRSGGETFLYTPSNTGTVIVFPTPLIYLPKWGATFGCAQSTALDRYGYVPQSVINHMAADPAIRSRYPDISACLPGGPSILSQEAACATNPFTPRPALPVDQATVSELTSSTVSTVYGWESSYALGQSGQILTPTPATTSVEEIPTPPSTPIPPIQIPELIQTTSAPTLQSPPQDIPALIIPPDSPSTTPTPLLPWIGLIISSILGIPQQTTTSANPNPLLELITAGSEPPSITAPGIPESDHLLLPTTTISGSTFLELPPTTIPFIPGLSIPGETTVLPDGNTQVIVTASTHIPLPSPSPPQQPSYPLPTTVISGTTYLSLSPTTIPLIPGLSIPGQTTVLPDGITAVIVPSSTLLALPPSPTALFPLAYPASLTVISGTTYLSLPPTIMPLIPGLSLPGKSTILPDGQIEVIVTASTLLPLPTLPPTTVISGTTYFSLSPTTMAIIPGLFIPGKTTVLPNGQTDVIVTASTLIPLPTLPPTTVISGTTYLELSPTTMAVIPGISIPGKTTMLPDGETEVVVTASTLVPLESGIGSGVVTTAIATTKSGGGSSSTVGKSALPSATKSGAAGTGREKLSSAWLCMANSAAVLVLML